MRYDFVKLYEINRQEGHFFRTSGFIAIIILEFTFLSLF